MNIILIGFMGAGKTTIGKHLAKQNNMSFIDTDALIEKNSSMLIKNIFRIHGEEYFRTLERDAIAGLSDMQNTIIAIGGGAVMFHDNLEKLKAIGCVVFLNTSLEQIFINLQGAFRPLIGECINKEKTRSLYEYRLSTYMKADIIIDTNGLSIDEISRLILKKVRLYQA